MSDNRASSGVRNLRAMFENKTGETSTSPPSRGRSPAGSEQSASSRPVSKVRNSFVAVERSGEQGQQWGLRKASDVSSSHPMEGVKEVKEDIAVDDVVSPAVEKASALAKPPATSNIAETPAKPVANGEPKKEELPQPTTTEASKTKGLGNILKGSEFEGSSALKSEEETPKTSQEPKLAPQSKEPAAPTTTTKDTVPDLPKSTEATAKSTEKTKNPSSPKTKTLPSRPSQISTSKDSPGLHTTSKTSPSKPPIKSPTAPRTPKTPKTPSTQASSKDSPSKPSAPKETAKHTREPAKDTKAPAKKPSRASLASTQHAPTAKTASPRTNGAKKPAQASPDHKPKPRSPTRPVRLPAAATAPTASSAAKTGGPPSRSPSRTSAVSGITRKPSTLKRDRPSIGSSAPTTSTIRKSASRPSLNSHSHEKTHERPKSRVSSTGKADEGFLARMMRPTASSAQKVHEKIEPKSPPRKIATSHVKPKRKSEAKPEDRENGSPVEARTQPVEELAESAEDLSQDAQAVPTDSATEIKEVEA